MDKEADEVLPNSKTLHFDGCTYPNWDGEDQSRSIAIPGDEVTIISPVSSIGGGTVHLVMKRVK